MKIGWDNCAVGQGFGALVGGKRDAFPWSLGGGWDRHKNKVEEFFRLLPDTDHRVPIAGVSYEQQKNVTGGKLSCQTHWLIRVGRNWQSSKRSLHGENSFGTRRGS
jgi:hypothetical protein